MRSVFTQCRILAGPAGCTFCAREADMRDSFMKNKNIDSILIIICLCIIAVLSVNLIVSRGKAKPDTSVPAPSESAAGSTQTLEEQAAQQAAAESAAAAQAEADAAASRAEEVASEIAASEEPAKEQAAAYPNGKPGFTTENINFDYINTLDNGMIGAGYYNGNRDELNRPNEVVANQDRYADYNAVFVRDPDNTVMLTFTLGYEAGYTAMVLDMLAERGIKATFFVNHMYASENPDLIRRMIDEGHVVGSHSWSHPEPGIPALGIEGAYQDMVSMQEYMRENFDYEVYLYSFPSGRFSIATLELARELGYQTVFWSFAHMDYDQTNPPSTEQAYSSFVSELHPGAIYLLHLMVPANPEALGPFIDYAMSEGYEFVTY